MNVLVLNCGSSSVKLEVIAVAPDGTGRRLARGSVERFGGRAPIEVRVGDRGPVEETVPAPDHAAAIGHLLERIRSVPIEASGHRVVHGGERFVQPVVVDDEVGREIEALEALAPLHNGPSLSGLRAARAALGPAVPMVAVFDTAFHAAMPEHAARYAIPRDLWQRHGVRRFGFHGTAYRSVLDGYAELTGRPAARARVVALHLGNGASAAAIREGRSVDTSMGFTPLEGLVMGTRSGDLDPALVGHLARVEGQPVEEVERWLNERSGLLGVSGRSADMRDLLAREATDPEARLAVAMFCYRARKYLGAYLAALDGADAVLLSGGIGERAPEVRARICRDLEWCGLVLDPARNAAAIGVPARLSPDEARLPVFVIPADEARVIARDTRECLTARA